MTNSGGRTKLAILKKYFKWKSSQDQHQSRGRNGDRQSEPRLAKNDGIQQLEAARPEMTKAWRQPVRSDTQRRPNRKRDRDTHRAWRWTWPSKKVHCAAAILFACAALAAGKPKRAVRRPPAAGRCSARPFQLFSPPLPEISRTIQRTRRRHGAFLVGKRQL